MNVRAKMRCNAVMPNSDGSVSVHLSAVYSTDPNHENKAFTDATPNAYLHMHIAKDKPAGEAFNTGQEYYVDFTPVGQ